MKKFYYKAKSGPDKVIEGEITAQNKEEVVAYLYEQGYIAAKVEEKGTDEIKQNLNFARISLKKRIFFSKQMAVLLRSNIAVLNSLRIIAGQIKNKVFRYILQEIEIEVENGKSLSSAMANYPQVFPPFFIAMVKAGEESGELPEAFLNLYQYENQQRDFFQKIKTALAYPLIVLFLGLITLVFLFNYVLPKIIPLILDLGVELPLLTKLLINLTNWISANKFLLVIILFLLFLIFYRARQVKTAKYYFSKLVVNIPIWGQLIFKSELSRFFRAMQMCLSSGISVTDSLTICLPLINEPAITVIWERLPNFLRQGGTISHYLSQQKDIDDFIFNMVKIGEESGNMQESFKYLSEVFEEDCAEIIRIITVLLEPAMLIFVAIIIAIVVMAILLPIFQLQIVSI